jgi:tetratricopeptide (TPR) repeat protein
VTIQAATSSRPDDPNAALIRQALAAARAGQLREACALAERALLAGGDPVAINALLGMVRLDLGEHERAIGHLEFAFEHRPTDMRIASDLTGALVALERFDRAFEVASRDLALADPTLQLARMRGAVAVQVKDLPAAIESLEYVVAAAPNDWESWNNLGNAQRVAKDLEASAKSLEQALAINPGSPEIWMNYGNVLRELRRTDEAETIFRQLAKQIPESLMPLRELHLLLRDASRDEEALEAIEAAVEREPNNADLLADKANHFAQIQKMDVAESIYRQVLEIDPTSARGFVGLALMQELTNRTDELAALADEAEARGVGDAVNFIRAYYYLRTKQFDAGLEALETVPEDLEGARQLNLRGQLLEGAGRYDEAFAAFSEMNEMFRNDPAQPEARGANYRDTIRGFHGKLTESWVSSWRPEEMPDPRSAPVFLVGFPRSGTTLLDTILMSHPQIEVLEEEPPLRTAMRLLPSFAELPTVPDEEIRAARDLYFDTVASIRAVAPEKLLIDKFPLTMNLLPFVRRIFPEARVILAVRHPCDVVLSCFIQNFRLNEGMSSFVRLDTAAELYDLSFSYLEHVQQLMPLPTHVVKYENIVADRARELRGLFDFLELDWHDSVLDHQSTALKRGRIKTASYHQVVEPIYTRSAGRWEKYRRHLEPVLPVLGPWARKFGYTTDES